MNDRATSGDNEALPWLEAVDDEDQPRGVSARKMLAALLMVAIAVAIIAGTTFYLDRQGRDRVADAVVALPGGGGADQASGAL